MLAERVAKTFGAWRAFAANRLPTTCKLAFDVRVPTPTIPGPDVAKMDTVFKVWMFAETEALTTGV
jgi:hypothetical protein